MIYCCTEREAFCRALGAGAYNNHCIAWEPVCVDKPLWQTYTVGPAVVA